MSRLGSGLIGRIDVHDLEVRVETNRAGRPVLVIGDGTDWIEIDPGNARIGDSRTVEAIGAASREWMRYASLMVVLS